MNRTGRHFLQIPGPTNVPERVMNAIGESVIDHRGPEFARMALEVLDGLQQLFQTRGPVVVYPSSGSGACEAALVNTLSPGDRVLVFETGWFSHMPWQRVCERLGLVVEYVPGTWRRGASPEDLEERLRKDPQHAIKAVVIVHNETSTGAVSRLNEHRRMLDRCGHPALLIVDAISSLGCMDLRHDEWGIDVTVCGSQKGLMVPPGLGFNAISEKALNASKSSRMPKSYWDWQDIIKSNGAGFFPYTPATNLVRGLQEALRMLLEEGLPSVFRRHAQYGQATRAAVRAWGLEIVCENPAECSNSLTAVLMPEGYNADELRRTILEDLDMSLGTGLGRLSGKAFRIGHLGGFNDLMLAGTLSGVEMGLSLAAVPHRPGGIVAALDSLAADRQTAEASVAG